MSINITNQESWVLAKFAYLNIENQENYKLNYIKKGVTLQEMSNKLLNEAGFTSADIAQGLTLDQVVTKLKASGNSNDVTRFGEYGALTDEEQYVMLGEIATGKYKNLSNLVAKDYDNQNDGNGFVAYAFSSGNDTVCAFRGSEGDSVSQGDTIDGKTGKDWIDNDYTMFRNVSDQFSSVDSFMKRNMVLGGKIYVAGHSKGTANCAYAAANFDGVTGFAYDGPGIEQCLNLEQIERLKKSGFINCGDQDDFATASFFHAEPRIYSKHMTIYKLKSDGTPELDKNGNKIEVLHAGLLDSGGHMTQSIGFDENQNVIQGERSQKSIIIEAVTQSVWHANELNGQPLGDLIDIVKIGKKEMDIFGTVLENMKNNITLSIEQNISKAQEEINQEISELSKKITPSLLHISTDANAIGLEVSKGLQDIQTKTEQILRSCSTGLSNDIDQVGHGFGSLLIGIVGVVAGKDLSQIKNLAFGEKDTIVGLTKLYMDSKILTEQLLGTVALETGETLWNIKDELWDITKELKLIAPQITSSFNCVADSIEKNFNDIKESVSKTINDNLKYVVDQTLILGKEIMTTRINAQKVKFQRVMDRTTHTVNSIINSVRTEFKERTETFKKGTKYLVDYGKRTMASLGENGSAVTRNFSKFLLQGMEFHALGRLTVDLIRLADLQSKMRNLERYFGERVYQILSDANSVTSDVGRNYSEYYVQQQIHAINRTCDQVRESNRRVCDTLERKANSLKYALVHYREIENLLCRQISG